MGACSLKHYPAGERMRPAIGELKGVVRRQGGIGITGSKGNRTGIVGANIAVCVFGGYNNIAKGTGADGRGNSGNLQHSSCNCKSIVGIIRHHVAG